MEKSERNQMPKKHFTEKEIKNLSNNPHVKSITIKGIKYTGSFSKIFPLFITTIGCPSVAILALADFKPINL